MISGCVLCFVVVVDGCGSARRNCCCCERLCWSVGKADLRSAFLVLISASCAIVFAVRCVLFDFVMLLVLLLFELGISQPDFLFVFFVEGGGGVGLEGTFEGESDLFLAGLRGGGDSGEEFDVFVRLGEVERCGVVAAVGGCDSGVC